jgi:nicotinamidase-related amidase
MKLALIIVDMLNDFVTGKLTCKRSLSVILPIQKLLEKARQKQIPVIYTNDEHLEGIDHELQL